MDKLPPIPTPLGTRWREFRYQYVPLITFCGLIVLVASMWRQYVMPPNVLAHVEPISARVMVPEAGTLVRLDVVRYQRVTKGQELGVVELMDTNAFLSSLAIVQADLQVMRARMGLDNTRNEQNYFREVLLLEQEKAQLAIDRVGMKRAEADFLRVSNLFHAKPPLDSEANYDLARYTFYALATNVAVSEKRLVEKENILPSLIGTNGMLMASAVENDIQVQVDLLRAQQRTVLRAPIDGAISSISNHVGETVLAGRPILVITALESTNILAYARQPLHTAPEVGDLVLVRKQAFRREAEYGRVVQVGTQLEPVERALLGNTGIRFGYEVGLPFLVNAPESLHLTPGERVDLVLKPKVKPTQN